MKVLLAVTILLVASIAANANTLALSPVNGNIFQQTIQRPCIFSNPSCANGTFPSTELPMGGNISSYDAVSPVYTGAALNSILAGGALQVGLDVMGANGQPPQTLSLFTMLKNGVVVDTFSFAGTGNVPAINDGNGFADYLITGFSQFTANDNIQFHFVFHDATAGPENLFLIQGPVISTPEPSSVLTLAFTLILGFSSWKAIHRKQSAVRISGRS